MLTIKADAQHNRYETLAPLEVAIVKPTRSSILSPSGPFFFFNFVVMNERSKQQLRNERSVTGITLCALPPFQGVMCSTQCLHELVYSLREHLSFGRQAHLELTNYSPYSMVRRFDLDRQAETS